MSSDLQRVMPRVMLRGHVIRPNSQSISCLKEYGQGCSATIGGTVSKR